MNYLRLTPKERIYRMEHIDTGLGPCQHPGPAPNIDYSVWVTDFTFDDVLKRFYNAGARTNINALRFGYLNKEKVGEALSGNADLAGNLGYGIAVYAAHHCLVLEDSQVIFIRDSERISFNRFEEP